jgi:hypothetical protein
MTASSVLLFNCRHVFELEDLLYILHDRELAGRLVLVVDSSQKKFAEEHGFRFVLVDFTDTKKFIPSIKAFKLEHNLSFAGVVGIDDECQFESTRQIAEAFDLTYFSRDTLHYASNKYLMKERFRKFGVPHPKHRLVENGGNPARGFDFPVVLKPAYGVSSSYVFLCKTPSELSRAIDYAKKRMRDDPDFSRSRRRVGQFKKYFSPSSTMVVEEYVSGAEFSCDYSVFNGKVGIVRVVRKIPSAKLGLFEGYHLLNLQDFGSRHGFTLPELRSVCGKVAKSLDFSEGVFMLDFKVTPKGISVLETAPRPGISTFIPLMNLLYGYNSFDVLMRKKLGLPAPHVRDPSEGLAIEIIAERGGRITEFSLDGVKGVERKFGSRVLSVYTYNNVGDLLQDEPGMHLDLIVGYVLAELKAGADPIVVRDFIYDNTKLLIDDGGGAKNGFGGRLAGAFGKDKEEQAAAC